VSSLSIVFSTTSRSSYNNIPMTLIRQIIKIFRLLGMGRAVRMKRRHEQALPYIRGYAAFTCWQILMNQGLLDKLREAGQIDLNQYAQAENCQPQILHAVVEYLQGIGLLEYSGSIVRLSRAGSDLLAEPRGMFELLWAYEPCFTNLPALLAGEKKYGRDLSRRITFVGLGSGRLCEQLPYPVMRSMVLEHRCRMVLDLGCGDLAFLSGLCRQDKNIRCHGIDLSEEMISYNLARLKKNNYHGRLTTQSADMFHLPPLPDDLPTVDCITACDTFHEYLDDEDRLFTLLGELRNRFPGVLLVVGEFCLQEAAWLRRHKTASLEHHLFHQLSGQQIGTAGQWRDIFRRAGLRIIDEQVFDMIGHGYFALR